MSVITDRFFTLARFVPLRSTAVSVVASPFLDHRVYAYGFLAYVLTDNERQVIAKFVDAVCVTVGAKRYLTTAYDPQANGQIERFNKTLVQRLNYYVEEHQKDRNVYFQSLTCAYSLHVLRSTETTYFSPVFSKHPSGLVMIRVTSQERDTAAEESTGPVQCKRGILRRSRIVLAHARWKLSAAQPRYEGDFDRKVRFHPKIKAGGSGSVDGPSRTVTEAETLKLGHVDGNITDAPRKLVPKSEGPYCVHLATDMVLHVV